MVSLFRISILHVTLTQSGVETYNTAIPVQLRDRDRFSPVATSVGMTRRVITGGNIPTLGKRPSLKIWARSTASSRASELSLTFTHQRLNTWRTSVRLPNI